DQHFNGKPQNIGILMGKPSGGLTDVDQDCDEVRLLARYFLPGTACRWGRPGSRDSHWLYITDPAVMTKQFKDITGEMMVELRGTGGHTLAPGSVHPSGEPISFEEDGEP